MNAFVIIISGLAGIVSFSLSETVYDTKRILTSELCTHESSSGELLLFLGQLEDVYVSAGSYIYFTNSFLISFYGVMISYLAVVVQFV